MPPCFSSILFSIPQSASWMPSSAAWARRCFFAGFFFFYLKIRKIEGLGFGDIKMVLLMGLFLGLHRLVVAIFLASLSGLLVGIFLHHFQEKKPQVCPAFRAFPEPGQLYFPFLGRWHPGLAGLAVATGMKKSFIVLIIIIQVLALFVFENMYSLFKNLEKNEIANIIADSELQAELHVLKTLRRLPVPDRASYFDQILPSAPAEDSRQILPVREKADAAAQKAARRQQRACFLKKPSNPPNWRLSGR